MRSKSFFAVAALLLALSLIASSCAQVQPSPTIAPTTAPASATPSPSPSESKKSESPDEVEWALKFETVTLAGDPVTHEDFAENKLTIINVWGTWCPPCVNELPHLQEVSEYYSDKGVQIVGVMQDGVNEMLEPVAEMIDHGVTLLEDAGADYVVLLPDIALAMTFINRMQYFPTTFFVDESGEVIKTVIGSKDTEGWKKVIDEVLESIE
ncbi:MAG: TlpA family protein disulfide reductase [Christensenellales bacterium]